ncbi:tetratricopeptide repeat protein [Leptospira langatensis]|uniref:Tetratricopeptide repeat protein n=1 Tax=Leptospira langatensis TaxID=2484983 RepID=A0A5F1ZWH5_9LEPT|nr:tetratricopeptide repeat protein [Leptospira langatensis]TGK00133.1 tetratricopeptide repeat protein [Leptospira langatensis]TGL42767.1 tetratricopeptide repeat protein [Leptospira langatensis]
MRYFLFVCITILSLDLYGQSAPSASDRADFEKADTYMRERDFQSALPILLKLSKSREKDDGLQYAVGFAYFQLNDSKNANLYFEKAISLDPNNARYRDHYGVSLYLAGDFQGAKKQFLKCIELDKASPNAYPFLGNIYLQENERAKAIDSFEKALEINPENLMALVNLSNLYFINREFKKSEKYLEESYRQDPNNFTLVNMLLENKFQLNKTKEAEMLKTALIKLRSASADERIKNTEYFRFDSFSHKDVNIVAQEAFQKSGDMYYYYIFFVYDKEDKLLKNINLESSAVVRALGMKYILSKDVFENGARKHYTSRLGFKDVPEYQDLKKILIKELDGEIEFTGSQPSK